MVTLASSRWALSESLNPVSSSTNTSQDGEKQRWNVAQSMLEMNASPNTERWRIQTLTLFKTDFWHLYLMNGAK